MISTNYTSQKRLMTRVHFNRIEMQRGGDHVWTVHSSEGCFQVKEVKILAPLNTVYKPGGVQPRAYFKGRVCIHVAEGVAYLR